jgi:hypothetical protein
MTTPQAADRRTRPEPVPARRPAAARLGWWAGFLTALTATAAWIMAVGVPGAPPRSGPNCTGGAGSCLTYPYTDAAGYVPDDFVWMVPAFLLGPLLVVLLTCLLSDIPARGRRRRGSRWHWPPPRRSC